MIPQYSRVAAVDDNEDHLRKIVWGLGKAGFCAIPFLFEDGRLENPPERPLVGLRIVFSDIHLIGGGPNNERTHAANIVRCLKKIVGNGPYVLIFWSQFPGDGERIAALIKERALDAGLLPPIGYSAIDKNEVFNTAAANQDDEFNAEKLRDLIVAEVRKFKTLAVAASWEDRVARASARTTDRLFQLVKSSDDAPTDWEGLLAYLASEAVGREQAKGDLRAALDAALLPLLEDQLSLIGQEPLLSAEDAQRLLDIISAPERCKCPASVTKSHLNASYQIEEIGSTTNVKMWGRGIVTELGSSFVNSGAFISAFGRDASALVRDEFATRDLDPDEQRAVKLHVVEIGAECDHVQGKTSTHRYLLAVLVPAALIGAFIGQQKGGRIPRTPQYRNDSVLDIGSISLRNRDEQEWHLLVSCRCFMALAAKRAVDGRPHIRLRRSLIDELAHRYTTHARRPGAIRFF